MEQTGNKQAGYVRFIGVIVEEASVHQLFVVQRPGCSAESSEIRPGPSSHRRNFRPFLKA